jgi:opacity protein-like surface antigen
MRKLMCGLVLAAVAACSWAQDGKGYVGIGGGVSRYKIDVCDFVSCDESGKAWNVRAGYHFFPWLGVEAAYLDWGEASVPGIVLNPPAGTVAIPTFSPARTYGFVVSLVGRVPLGPVGLMARVGWGGITGKFSGSAAVQNTTTGEITYLSAKERNTGGSFVYGLGVNYEFYNQWSARFDWDHTKADDGYNSRYEVDSYTLGVHYRF